MLGYLARAIGVTWILALLVVGWGISNWIRSMRQDDERKKQSAFDPKMIFVINHVMKTTDPDEISRMFQEDMQRARQRFEQ